MYMMGRHTPLVCAISLLVVLLNVAAAVHVLRIGSFNIENFAGRKLHNQMIRKALIQVSNYQLLLLFIFVLKGGHGKI